MHRRIIHALMSLALVAGIGGEAASQAPEPLPSFWPYSFGEPGRIASRRDVPDLGVTFLTFENGVRVAVRPMHEEKGEIDFRIWFGRGRLDFARTRLDGAYFGWLLMANADLGRIKYADLFERSKAEKLCFIYTPADTQDDAFALIGRLQPNETVIPGDAKSPRCKPNLALLFSYAAAELTDSSFEKTDWPKFIRRMARSGISENDSDYLSRGQRILRSGDARWMAPRPRDYANMQLADALRVQAAARTSPLEVTIAGDITVEQAIAAMAPSIGALPPREEMPEPEGLRASSYPKAPKEPILLTGRKGAKEAYIFLDCPSEDWWANQKRLRTSYIMARILDRRLKQRFPPADPMRTLYASFDASRVLPGFGYVHAQLPATPATFEAVEAGLKIEVDRLKAEPVPAEEFSAAVEQVLVYLGRGGAPLFWVMQLHNADRDPRRLDYLRTKPADYRAITPADVQSLARRWFVDAKCLRFRETPK